LLFPFSALTLLTGRSERKACKLLGVSLLVVMPELGDLHVLYL